MDRLVKPLPVLYEVREDQILIYRTLARNVHGPVLREPYRLVVAEESESNEGILEVFKNRK